MQCVMVIKKVSHRQVGGVPTTKSVLCPARILKKCPVGWLLLAQQRQSWCNTSRIPQLYGQSSQSWAQHVSRIH